MSEWQKVDTCPEGIVVDTKIDDAGGVRNEQPLIRRGSLFFYSDETMYVYYRPTHWKSKVAA